MLKHKASRVIWDERETVLSTTPEVLSTTPERHRLPPRPRFALRWRAQRARTARQGCGGDRPAPTGAQACGRLGRRPPLPSSDSPSAAGCE